MNVRELISELEKIEDKYLTVSVITNGGEGWFVIDKIVTTDSFGCTIGVLELK